MLNVIQNTIGAIRNNAVASANLKFEFSVNTAESGTSNDDQFTITVGSGTFLYDLTTSDGHSETGLTGNHTITFSSSGIYSISISGQFPAFRFNGGNDGEKMATLDNFGIYGGGSTSHSNAFRGCDNMILNATDSGNFGSATNFEKFLFASYITGTSFPLIDTSSATSFDNAFRRTRIANFPANLFDNCTAINFDKAFLDTILSEQSIDNILVSLDAAGQSGGTFYQSGGSAPSSVGIAAANRLADPTTKQWTITYTGQ